MFYSLASCTGTAEAQQEVAANGRWYRCKSKEMAGALLILSADTQNDPIQSERRIRSEVWSQRRRRNQSSPRDCEVSGKSQVWIQVQMWSRSEMQIEQRVLWRSTSISCQHIWREVKQSIQVYPLHVSYRTVPSYSIPCDFLTQVEVFICWASPKCRCVKLRSGNNSLLSNSSRLTIWKLFKTWGIRIRDNCWNQRGPLITLMFYSGSCLTQKHKPTGLPFAGGITVIFLSHRLPLWM